MTQEFGSENIKLLKQKDAYPYEYMDSFERLSEKKFIWSLKHGITNDKGKKLDGHITDEGIFNMHQNLE